MGNPAISIQQWETLTNQWANGQANQNQSTYLEGDVVPYWLEGSNLTVGTTYGVRINMNTYQSNTDAGGFVYMDTYNDSITNITQNPDDGTGSPLPSLTTDSSFTFSDPSYSNPGLAFYVNNADVLSVTYSLSPDGLDRYADVTFTPLAANETDGEATANIYWGQTLALPDQVITTVNSTPGSKGASGFTGGSLQTKIDGTGAAGATWITPSNAVQLMPGVVKQGSISGYKWKDANENTQWDNGEVGLSGWTIELFKDDGDSVFEPGTGDTLVGTQVTANGTTDANGDGSINTADLGFYKFAPLLRGTYFVREVQQAGWTQTYPSPNNVWGPLTIDTLNPTRTNINFGNKQSEPPTISVVKEGSGSINEGGGVASYTFTITNSSAVTDPVTITSLNDDKFGDLLAEAVADNGGNSIVIQPGAKFTFDITRSLTLDATGGTVGTYQTSHTNTITVVGKDDEGVTATATDPHTVTGADVAPTINIVKNGSATVKEGGGVASYTFTITNASAITDPVTITSISDDKFGSLLAEAVTDNGGNNIVINPNGSFSFDITRSLSLDAGDTHTNIVTVTGKDDEGTTDSGTDDHTVTGADVAPTINIVKNGSSTVKEGGGVASYTFTITNASAITDPVTITSISDDKFGDLLSEAVTDNGGNTIVINPNATFTFDITRSLSLDAGDTHTNIVTVTGKDDEGTTDSGTDDHTVTGTDVAPTINIVKNGSSTVNEGGGVANYTFTITNSSAVTDPVTITSLNDDKFGSLLAEAVTDNGGNNIVINPNGSFTFDITRSLTLDAGETHINTVTVIGKDDEGTTTTATDNHTVSGQDVAPTIDILKNGPATLNEGGGTATYTFTIFNKSVATDPVTITSISDDKFGSLLAEAQADNGGNTIVINPNATFTFDITRSLTLDATGGTVGTYQTSHTNTVTVIGKDDEGTTDSGTDDHTITGANVAPTISVEKNASPTSFLETTGANVTYTVKITNNSVVTDPVTITSLPDLLIYDTNGTGIYGDTYNSLADQTVLTNRLADAQADWLAQGKTGSIVLQPGQTFTFDYTVAFAGGNTLNTWEDPANTITAIGVDDEGSSVSAFDDAKVNVLLKNKRSIVIDKLTGEQVAPATNGGNNVSGYFHIRDASSDAATIDVLINNLSMQYEKKVGPSWTAISPSPYPTQFWVENGTPNGILDAGETLLTDLNPTQAGLQTSVVFDQDINIGYRSSLSPLPNPLRATVNVNLFEDSPVVFKFTNSFTF
ncbi:hypothetical protein [Microseira wollei]|uniref:Peptidase S8 and S53, subtilisin, kexin, sedolisin n=1 Tax=Microseira wollei NIES-4236 TaxID=2530354 RepID=A0AAV3XHS6_9CYAN|nr:hypothetical protein [Microseira wollei]GET41989.1 peptidase S8 and S53, subtilisin, kexin, sedolisin [Microseira wollei NIES-4236]